jgi:hypothetical protein
VLAVVEDEQQVLERRVHHRPRASSTGVTARVVATS